MLSRNYWPNKYFNVSFSKPIPIDLHHLPHEYVFMEHPDVCAEYIFVKSTINVALTNATPWKVRINSCKILENADFMRDFGLQDLQDCLSQLKYFAQFLCCEFPTDKRR